MNKLLPRIARRDAGIIFVFVVLAIALTARASLELKQSTAVTVKIGPFTDITDGTTRETALTIDYTNVYLAKNGAAMAAKHDDNDLSHDALGVYGCKLDTTDTATLGILRVDVNDLNAIPVWAEFEVVDANYYNFKYSTTTLPVKLTSDGLDNIPTTDPNGVANTYPEMQVQLWRRFFKRAARTASHLYTYNDANIAETTQDYSNDGTNEIYDNAQ